MNRRIQTAALHRVAELAGLPAPTHDRDMEDRLAEVSTLLDHVRRLQAVNTDGVPPTYVFPPPSAMTTAEGLPSRESTEDPSRLRALFVREEEGALLVPSPKAGHPRG